MQEFMVERCTLNFPKYNAGLGETIFEFVVDEKGN